MGLLNISRKKPLFVREAFHAKSWREWSKKSSSKAAATLARGAYFQYVSTTKWRERRWRLFSTFPKYKWWLPSLLPERIDGVKNFGMLNQLFFQAMLAGKVDKENPQ